MPQCFQKLITCIITVSCLSLHLTALEISEDFESYKIDNPTGEAIAGKGWWLDSAFGKDIVIVQKNKQNNVLKASNSGDHHILFKPSFKELQEIIQAPAWCLEFDFSKNIHLLFGQVSKYKNQGLEITANRSLSFITPDKQLHSGFAALQKGLYRIRLLVVRKPGTKDIKLTLSYKNLTSKDSAFQTEANLKDIPFTISNKFLKTWNGLKVRLDSGAEFDNLKLYSMNRIDELQKKAVLHEIKPPFKADLSSILPPRQAIDLSGIWQYCAIPDFTSNPSPNTKWKPVLVPNQHNSLFRQAKNGRLWFRTTFKTPENLNNQNLFLNFESVIGDCDIYVNGKHVKHQQNSWVPFEVDISKACKKEGENELMITIKSAKQSGLATEQPMGWSWYGPHYDGIAFPVHLEVKSPVYVKDVFIKPNVSASPYLTTEVTVCNNTNQTVTTTLAASAGKEFSHTEHAVVLKPHSSTTISLKDPWPKPKLWWPHSPHLYNLDVQLAEKNTIIDAKRQRFGFREIKVDGPNILINKRKLLHRRASPIVYYPHLQKDNVKEWFDRYKKQGYNGLRLHGGAPGRILQAADEEGMLICYESKINEPRGHQVKEKYWPRASKYLTDMVKAYRNHPSVIYWAVSNEFGSYYMRGTPEQKKWVDNWLHLMGQQIMRLDPTRTVTYCGDCELGGKGKHGPAPNLNLHYAWQQTKSRSKIPATIYWLEEGGMPWQGIVWDKTKPVLLNEDIYPAYAWNPPWGMTQWSGDSVFDDKGYYQSWFDAIRMLAEGYYHSGVACWNPWATSAGKEKAPLYDLGNPMPDFLINTKKWNRTFESGQQVKQQLFIHNKTFRDLECHLTSDLSYGSTITPSFSADFLLKGGDFKEFNVTLSMPETNHKLPVSWKLTLKNNGKTLCERTFSYTVFPKFQQLQLPDKTVVIAQAAIAEKLFAKSAPVYSDINAALANNPEKLIMIKPNLSRKDITILDHAVQNGLQVLLLEVEPNSSLPTPLKIAEKQFGAHAFIRNHNDPVTAKLNDEDLKWWAQDTFVYACPIYKPSRGNFDILVDAGSPSGMNAAPVLRLNRGQGSYTICQLSTISKLNFDPAAADVLKSMVDTMQQTKETNSNPIYLIASNDSPLRNRLTELNIPFSPLVSSLPEKAVLIVDGSETITTKHIQQIQHHLEKNGTVMLQRLNQENADKLNTVFNSNIKLENASVTNLVKRTGKHLFDGISNDDLCWKNCGNKVWPASGKRPAQNAPSQVTSLAITNSSTTPLTKPAGIVQLKTNKGNLIICQLCWDNLAKKAPTRSARFALTFLKNLGADIGNLNLKQRIYKHIDMRQFANGNFRTWFGADDDMRYFPVNQTGIDPLLKVPQPVEPFPEKPIKMGGLPFKIINPSSNNNNSCIILEASNTTIPINSKINRLWLLGALDKMTGKTETVANIIWDYADGESKTVPIQSTIHLNGYQWPKEPSKGRIGWLGPSKKEMEAVIWTWDHPNPHPDKTVKAIRIEKTTPGKLAIVAATGEVEK